METEWTFDDPSGKPAGWYAVIICWDAQEGLFPSASWWDGTGWDDTSPKSAFHGPHPSKQAAEDWAYEHDPEK